MNLLVTLATTLLPILAGPQDPQSPPGADDCPTPTAEEIELQKQQRMSDPRSDDRVNAVVGVDALGRVLLAVDNDENGAADDLFLFTPRQRLEGPWTELLRAARIDSTAGTLRVEAADRSLAITLAVAPGEPPRLSARDRRFGRIIRETGFELVRNTPDPKVPLFLESFDHNNLESWPSSFRRDLVTPTTTGPNTCVNCGGTKCTRGGGCFSTGCGTECEIITDDRCNISCSWPQSFACCNCTLAGIFSLADCRCIGCKRQVDRR